MAVYYHDEIEIFTSDFRSKMGLSNSEPIDCKNLLLRLNILTIYRKLSESFSGMCLKREDKNFILVNSSHSRGRQHFTIGHELYHLFAQKEFSPHFCNTGSGNNNRELNEKKADLFSSILLMPELGIKKNIPPEELKTKNITVATLLRLERIFSVSHIAMLFRLKNIGVIDSDKFEYFNSLPICQLAVQYGYDTSLYEKGNDRLVIGNYGTLAKKKFDEGHISEGHYRELMSAIGIDLNIIDNGNSEN